MSIYNKTLNRIIAICILKHHHKMKQFVFYTVEYFVLDKKIFTIQFTYP
jgi:hypothetical protein